MASIPRRLRSRLWIPFALAALPNCVWCPGYDADLPDRAEECTFRPTEVIAVDADGGDASDEVPVYAAGPDNSRILVRLPTFNAGTACWWVVAGALDDELPFFQQAVRFDGEAVLAIDLGESRFEARERNGVQVRLHGPNGQLLAQLEGERTAAMPGSARDAEDPLPLQPTSVPCAGVEQGAGIELGDLTGDTFTVYSEQTPAELRRDISGTDVITPWVQIDGAVPENRCGWVTVREIQSRYFGDLGLFPFGVDRERPVAGPLWVPIYYDSGDVDEGAVANLEVEVIVAGMRHLRMLSVPVRDSE